MTPITFFAAGLPKPQPRPRAFARRMGDKFVARVYDAGTAEGWKSQIAVAAERHIPQSPLSQATRLRILFVMPRPKSHYRKKPGGILTLREDAPREHTGRPDLDNLEKAVMDCLTVLGFWTDDGIVAAKSTGKVYGDKPGAHVLLDAMPDIGPIRSMDEALALFEPHPLERMTR